VRVTTTSTKPAPSLTSKPTCEKVTSADGVGVGVGRAALSTTSKICPVLWLAT
jgi:hypothetical protein